MASRKNTPKYEFHVRVTKPEAIAEWDEREKKIREILIAAGYQITTKTDLLTALFDDIEKTRGDKGASIGEQNISMINRIVDEQMEINANDDTQVTLGNGRNVYLNKRFINISWLQAESERNSGKQINYETAKKWLEANSERIEKHHNKYKIHRNQNRYAGQGAKAVEKDNLFTASATERS